MAYPPKYDRQHSFTNWQEEHPGSPLPADWVEDELNTAKVSIDSTIDSLKQIQRSDGALGNRTVGFDQLKPEARVGIRQPVVWASGVAFKQYDCASFDAAFYVATVDHTSGVTFATDLQNGKWTLILDFASVAVSADSARDEAVAANAAAQTARAAAESAATAAGLYKDAAEALVSGSARTLQFEFAGSGYALEPGLLAMLTVDFAGQIKAVRTASTQTGSLVVDIRKAPWASAPPTSDDSICASAKPTLSSAKLAEDTTLTGWQKSFAAKDVFLAYIESCSGIDAALVALEVEITA